MAAYVDGRSGVLPAVIVGLCLLVGLSAGGYCVGRGGLRFKSDARTVTVKGLVEREAAVAFLEKQGFPTRARSRSSVWTAGTSRPRSARPARR